MADLADLADLEEWFKKYNGLKDHGPRYDTMLLALQLVGENPVIVETGCVRLEGDYGGGMSTVIFGDFTKTYGGRVITIDNDPEHVATCSRLLGSELKDQVTIILNDSVDGLTDLSKTVSTIDFLYLDSWDYPYGDLLDIYGGKTDIDAAMTTLDSMSEEEIVAKHIDIIKDSQEHCVRELEAALPLLNKESVVMIDDARLPGGGKARLVKKELVRMGWKCLRDEYQTLWVRK